MKEMEDSIKRANAQRYISPFAVYEEQYQQRLKAKEDSIKMANSPRAEQEKAREQAKKQNGKKKRKKFLGIF